MVFKREKLLIKISAILAIINLIFMWIFGFVIERLSNNPEFTDSLSNIGVYGAEDLFRFNIFIDTILRIVVIVILFIIANKLNTTNYKTYGTVAIILGIISFNWLLGFISSILVIIAGIMIFINSKKILVETHHDER